MAYYGRGRGDYYRGDYYRGDPGFFGNLFRGIIHTVGGAAIGMITGGPVGAIVGAAKGAGSAARENVAAATLEAGGAESAFTPELRAAHAAALARRGTGAAATLPGGAMIVPPMGMGMMVPGMRGMRRQHPNRSTYVTRGGGTSRWPVGLQVHPKGTELVPSRRMNVANPRALRRSIRRLVGFAKIVKRVRGAVGRAASAVGVRHGRRAKTRAPSVRVVRAA